MSDDSRSSSFDFFIQFSCLALLCGSVGVLFYTMQRQPQRGLSPRATIAVPVVLPSSPVPTTTSSRPLAVHTKPPQVPDEAILQLTGTLKDKTEHTSTGFLVNIAAQQPVVISIASQLGRNDWESISKLTSNARSLPTLNAKPDWIGSITRDNHPNMLDKPDLSNDLIVWKVAGKNSPPALPLAKELVKVDTPVWVLSLPLEKPLHWLKGYVIDATVNCITVKPEERFDGDKLTGTIIVNEAGEIISLTMGGEFALIGSSSVGILKKLNETVPTP